jgi:hypothetical protein
MISIHAVDGQAEHGRGARGQVAAALEVDRRVVVISACLSPVKAQRH